VFPAIHGLLTVAKSGKMENPAFKVELIKWGDPTVVKLSGELDFASASQLEASLGLVGARGAGAAVLDLSGLAFVDAGGIREIYELCLTAESEGKRVWITSARPHVRRVMEILGVYDYVAARDRPSVDNVLEPSGDAAHPTRCRLAFLRTEAAARQLELPSRATSGTTSDGRPELFSDLHASTRQAQSEGTKRFGSES
jgi:anti-anti-sigma factor